MMPRGVLAKFLRRGDVFVETGTRWGDTVALAIELGARKVYSCESNPDRLARAKSRIGPEAGASLFHERSRPFLERLLPTLEDGAVFWLDAHTGTECSVVGELEVLKRHADRVRVLLVDDMAHFRNGTWGISAGTVFDLVSAVNPRFVVSLEDGYHPYDILAARVP